MTKLAQFALYGSLLLAACQAAPSSPTLTNEGPATAESEAPAAEAATGTQPQATATLPNVEACKLPVGTNSGVALGFPRLASRMPSTGTVKAVVLFADFPDAPATRSPEDVFAVISPQAEAFYRDISYGRLDFQLVPHFAWLRLSQPSSASGAAITSYDGHRAFVQEAVDLADPDVDFSDADLVVVLANPDAVDVPYGPTFTGDPGSGINADGHEILNGITSGYDLTYWGFMWLNHEAGHSMGLADLYGYSGGTHRFVGGWSMMGLIGGRAPEYLAFERWMLGWLDDAQILCLESGEQTAELSAIETAGGTKAVIVPVDAFRAVVIESRRALGYDDGLEETGALVYLVNTLVYSGEGTILVYPADESDQGKYTAPLAEGESLTVEGVTITVLEATGDGDTVQVSVSP